MTLVEVMVSLVILSLIGTALWASFSQTAKNKLALEAESEHYHGIRVALERMTRELSMAYVSTHLNDDLSLQVMKTAFIGTDRGDRDRIDFTSFSHQRLYRDAKESDQNEISYFVGRHPDDSSRMVLARREQNRPDDYPEKGGRVQILLEDIEELNFEYLDPQSAEWSRSWDTTQLAGQPNRLPTQVRITLVVADYDDPREERRFTTRAVLPLTWALNHANYR
jgi:general secretion pathway protein J